MFVFFFGKRLSEWDKEHKGVQPRVIFGLSGRNAIHRCPSRARRRLLGARRSFARADGPAGSWFVNIWFVNICFA